MHIPHSIPAMTYPSVTAATSNAAPIQIPSGLTAATPHAQPNNATANSVNTNNNTGNNTSNPNPTQPPLRYANPYTAPYDYWPYQGQGHQAQYANMNTNMSMNMGMMRGGNPYIYGYANTAAYGSAAYANGHPNAGPAGGAYAAPPPPPPQMQQLHQQPQIQPYPPYGYAHPSQVQPQHYRGGQLHWQQPYQGPPAGPSGPTQGPYAQPQQSVRTSSNPPTGNTSTPTPQPQNTNTTGNAGAQGQTQPTPPSQNQPTPPQQSQSQNQPQTESEVTADNLRKLAAMEPAQISALLHDNPALRDIVIAAVAGAAGSLGS